MSGTEGETMSETEGPATSGTEGPATSGEEFDWLELDDDEEVVWSSHPELLGYAGAFVFGVALIPVFGLGLLILAWAYLDRKNTNYVITTNSVFEKKGVFSRTVTDIGHNNIQDTGYRQSPVGRYFGFGTVEISTAGGSGVEMALAYVSDPLSVQSTLDRMVGTGASKRDGRGRESESSRSVRIDEDDLNELLGELRATREAMESIERRLSEG